MGHDCAGVECQEGGSAHTESMVASGCGGQDTGMFGGDGSAVDLHRGEGCITPQTCRNALNRMLNMGELCGVFVMPQESHLWGKKKQ